MDQILSLLSAGEISEIHSLEKQGLQTEFALQDPPQWAIFRRSNPDTGEMEDIPNPFIAMYGISAYGYAHFGEDNEIVYQIAITYAADMTNAAAAGGGSMESSLSRGILRCFAPLPIMEGDRFTLPSGSPAMIAPPWPRESNGIITASWVAIEGAI